ncbi:MAG: four helix bundle protein [Bacilli bacterium]|nr:four helix bundle protein [Bacilli bacterium]
MNDRFLIVKYIKEFIYSIDDFVINFPRKEFVIKDRIINDSLDILEMIYIVNFDKNRNNLKYDILSKLSMLDFYLERCYKNKIINEKLLRKKSSELSNITKMMHGWIRSDSKCS